VDTHFPGSRPVVARNLKSKIGGHAKTSRIVFLAVWARISLDRTLMQVEENLVNLSPGMAVTVEIKTGSRTVLTYLLSPLLRYKQESLRER
jgi:hypothetical protein